MPVFSDAPARPDGAASIERKAEAKNFGVELNFATSLPLSSTSRQVRAMAAFMTSCVSLVSDTVSRETLLTPSHSLLLYNNK